MCYVTIMNTKQPTTLLEAIRHFADPEVSLALMVELRWPNGVCCPSCDRRDVTFIPTRRLWECKGKHPKRQFSAKVGTIFEDSPLGLDKWFAGIWLIANCKNGISSYEFARDAGITQKSAWFLLHRVRLAMKAKSFVKLDGEVEVDETYIGGSDRNRPVRKRKGIPGPSGKEAVVGAIKRKGPVVAKVVPTADMRSLLPFVHATVSDEAQLLSTDDSTVYRSLGLRYKHGVVRHVRNEYVKGRIHTNTIENFWSLLKRTLKGTYVSVEPIHLGAYVDEQAFRLNERQDSDYGRFRKVLSSVFGLRLTYRELIEHGAVAAPT